MGWALPPLAGTAGIDLVEEAPRLVMDAVSFDTTDLRLIRDGITLRYRVTPEGTRQLPGQPQPGRAEQPRSPPPYTDRCPQRPTLRKPCA